MAPPHREAYGPEWEKEITNLSKNALAQMIRRKSKELDTLEDQKIQLVGVLKWYGEIAASFANWKAGRPVMRKHLQPRCV